jgi:all-trans-retinol 13,14-reductase
MTKNWPHRQSLQKIKRSVAHLGIYLGLKQENEALKLPKANYWVYPHEDHDNNVEQFSKDPHAPPSVTYISFPSNKDPSWKERFPGRSTIEIVGQAPYEWFQQWEGKAWRRRGEDYEQFKQALAKPHLDRLFKLFPHLSSLIDYTEISGPLSTQTFCSYDKGEIYGLEHTPERFINRHLRPQTPLKNFYLSGQDVVTAGVGGAAMAAVLTATVCLKKNILKKI